MTSADRLAAWGTLLLALLPLLGFWWASAGVFGAGELVHWLAADAMADGASLFVRNGYESFGAAPLRLWHLTEGQGGLVPTSAPAYPILVRPLVEALGLRALMVTSVLAAAALLLVTARLARRAGAGPGTSVAAVAILAASTFFLEQAWALSPAMLAAALATGALWLTLRAGTGDEPEALRDSAVAGALLGTATLFGGQIGPLLALLAFWTAWQARDAATVAAGGLLGMVPPLATWALLDWLRFGAVDGAGAGWPAFAVGLASVGGLALRRRATPAPGLAGIGLVTAGALLLLVFGPETPRALWAHLVDIRLVEDGRPGVHATSAGTVFFWGAARKALGQSLPWLGILAALAWARPDPRRLLLAAAAAAAVVQAVLAAPPEATASNLRHALPALPPLAVLAALVLSDAARRTPHAPLALAWGALIAVLGALLSARLGIDPLAGPQQKLALAALGAILLAALGSRLLGRRQGARALLIAGGAGLALGTWNAAHDIAFAEIRRAETAESSRIAAGMPGPVLFIGMPEAFASVRFHHRRLVAAPDPATGEADPALAEAALRAGYYVWVEDALAARLLRRAPALRRAGPEARLPAVRLVLLELVPARPDDARRADSGTDQPRVARGG